MQAWNTIQDSTDDISIDKVEANLDRQEHFSQFQDTTDALLCHSHLPVCLWIVDPHSRVPKKNTTMEPRCHRRILRSSCKDHVTNEVFCAKIQQIEWPHEDLLTIVKRRKLNWYGHVFRSSGMAKTILQDRLKGEKTRETNKRGGRTKSRNGQAWSSPSPRGQLSTEKNRGNWLWSHLRSPNDPRGSGIGEGEDTPAACLSCGAYSVCEKLTVRGMELDKSI